MKKNEYFSNVPTGENTPEDIYAIIEIPANTYPVKYEINKETGHIFVDRFIPTTLLYPCNYGYINNTLSHDGDPLDVLVHTPYPLYPGTIIRCKPIGMLDMTDESGKDVKILAVPHETLSTQYNKITDINLFPKFIKTQISYFFKHYKDLEKKKWVKINSWKNSKIAKEEIINSLILHK
ncbi:MAG: inorganic pyrophosphatase [Candidatus Westeberhardia cardiocondylae]|nr:inorganic pyrophosphatase [Candidatus Westeberhardia cardiocondylae]